MPCFWWGRLSTDPVHWGRHSISCGHQNECAWSRHSNLEFACERWATEQERGGLYFLLNKTQKESKPNTVEDQKRCKVFACWKLEAEKAKRQVLGAALAERAFWALPAFCWYVFVYSAGTQSVYQKQAKVAGQGRAWTSQGVANYGQCGVPPSAGSVDLAASQRFHLSIEEAWTAVQCGLLPERAMTFCVWEKNLTHHHAAKCEQLKLRKGKHVRKCPHFAVEVIRILRYVCQLCGF